MVDNSMHGMLSIMTTLGAQERHHLGVISGPPLLPGPGTPGEEGRPVRLKARLVRARVAAAGGSVASQSDGRTEVAVSRFQFRGGGMFHPVLVRGEEEVGQRSCRRIRRSPPTRMRSTIPPMRNQLLSDKPCAQGPGPREENHLVRVIKVSVIFSDRFSKTFPRAGLKLHDADR